MSEKKEWLTPNDLREEFSFSISNQARLRMLKLIPFCKIGKYIRYKRSDIEIWFNNHKVVDVDVEN